MKGIKRRLRYKTEIQVEKKGVIMLISRTLNWTVGSNWGFLRWLKETETHSPTCLYSLQSSGVSTSISPGTWRWARHARGLEDILIISGSQLPSGWPLMMISYGLNCVSPHKPHMLKPYPLCCAFGNRAYKDVLTKMGSLQCILIQSDCCPYKRRLRYTEGWPREEAARWWSSTSQGERYQRKSTLQTPWPWTSSLRNCEKINFCCLGYPVCGILLYSSLTRLIIILHAFSTFLGFSHHFF